MPIDARIPLMAQAPQQQNPLNMLMQMMQYKQAMEQNKLNTLKLQQMQQQGPLQMKKLQAQIDGIPGEQKLKQMQLKKAIGEIEQQQDQQIGRNELIKQLTPNAGGNPMEAGVHRLVIPDEKEAVQRMIAADARGEPMSINVPNQANMMASAIRADPKAGAANVLKSYMGDGKPEYGSLTPGAVPYNKRTGEPKGDPIPFNKTETKLEKLFKLRESLPPDSPQRQVVENAIKKESEFSPDRVIVAVDVDGKPVFINRSDAVGKVKAPSGNNATFAPQTLRFIARQYLAGDRQAISGFAKNATARINLQNAIAAEAIAQGLSPAQVASKMAEYAGLTSASRSVGQRAAGIALASQEAQDMIHVVKEQSDKFSRGEFVPWNMAIKAWESNTGDPNISAFGASLNALVNTYARAINPSGVPTDSDKIHAREVINSVQSPTQVDAVLRVINQELEIAKKAPKSVTQQIKRTIEGEGRKFNSVEEMEAAELEPGTKVIINGQSGTYQPNRRKR